MDKMKTIINAAMLLTIVFINNSVFADPGAIIPTGPTQAEWDTSTAGAHNWSTGWNFPIGALPASTTGFRGSAFASAAADNVVMFGTTSGTKLLWLVPPIGLPSFLPLTVSRTATANG